MAAPLIRTFDGSRLTEVANHPTVRPHLGLLEIERLDLMSLVADPANVAFDGPHGGFLLHRLGPGVLEAHSMVLPEGRGGLSTATAQVLRYAFTATDALKVVTKVPAYNEPASRLAAASGFRSAFRREESWPQPDGALCATDYRILTFDDWMLRDADLLAAGQSVGDLIGFQGDELWLRAVGFLALGLQAGNAQKSLWRFNEWAAFAGHDLARQVSAHPDIISIQGVALHASANRVEVMQCP